jgi:hypothetical protein
MNAHDVSTCCTNVVSQRPHLEQCSLAGNFCGQSFAFIGLGLLLLLLLLIPLALLLFVRFEVNLDAPNIIEERDVVAVAVGVNVLHDVFLFISFRVVSSFRKKADAGVSNTEIRNKAKIGRIAD